MDPLLTQPLTQEGNACIPSLILLKWTALEWIHKRLIPKSFSGMTFTLLSMLKHEATSLYYSLCITFQYEKQTEWV